MAFGWGIVSTGRHPDVKVAPAMSAVAGGELVAVYSRDQGRADAFAERHGARAAYGKLDDLLSDPRVDGVFVCSPNALHAAHVIRPRRPSTCSVRSRWRPRSRTAHTWCRRAGAPV